MRHCGVEHVLIDVITRTGVNKKNIFLDVAVWQQAEPLKTVLAQAVDRPPDDRRCVAADLRRAPLGSPPVEPLGAFW